MAIILFSREISINQTVQEKTYDLIVSGIFLKNRSINFTLVEASFV